jgi:hypothetical protein
MANLTDYVSTTFSDSLTLESENQLRFTDSDNSNYVGFKSPSTVSTNTMWVLPASDGTNGQILTTNGSATLTWADVPVSLPDQSGNSGQFLTTDGTTASWAEVSGITTFPFYKADGSSDTIAITNGQFPFYKADGSQDNIGVS